MTASHPVRSWLTWWVVLLGFYELLVARLSWAEAGAGAVAAALAATAVVVTKRAGPVAFRVRLAWLVHFVRLPWRILADNGIVLAALLGRLVARRPIQGRFRSLPFRPGGDDPTDAARRALVITGISVAPNTYVVGVDAQRGLLLVHQLVPSSQPPGRGDPEWPL